MEYKCRFLPIIIKVRSKDLMPIVPCILPSQTKGNFFNRIILYALMNIISLVSGLARTIIPLMEPMPEFKLCIVHLAGVTFFGINSGCD